MKFDIVTIFPRMFERPTGEGVVARGLDAGVIDLRVHDLRDFTTDRHRVVDDVPYGGGPGMVMKPEPFFRAVAHIRAARGEPGAVLLTSPQGRPLTDRWARTLATQGHVVILCGRYEGVDDRVRAHLATEEISIGDYVLSGGELAAMVVMDCVVRQIPGVLGDAESARQDSFVNGLLDCPHYTRPETYKGEAVPPVLMSGNHAEISRWRLKQALGRTWQRRPDLLAQRELSDEELALLEDFKKEA
jgi:tRNA (guanine37-N1)-methyltransferase